MSNSEDITLISRVLLFNDTRAFDRLTLKYQSPVRRFLLHLTHGDRDLSDDIAQETFIKAYLNIQHFKGIAKFSTWLMRIAYNLYLDCERSQKNRKTENIEQLTCEIQEPQTTETEYDIEEMLCLLKPEEKAVVLLFYMEDQPLKKISKIMDMPINSVKSHLHRAKTRMREKMNGEKNDKK
jgi:RNA polymerase sigma-70 factor (ECF subfamily)